MNLLRVDEAASLFEQWAEEGAGELVAELTADETTRLRLIAVIRLLICGSAPLTDWRRVLETFRQADAIVPVEAVVRAIRHELRETLPGNAPDRVRVVIPGEIEDKLAGWRSGACRPPAGASSGPGYRSRGRSCARN